MASLKLLPVWSGPPLKGLGVVDYTQRFAPIFNDDSLANLVKSLVKHRGRVFQRIP
jgi:hypothetical protein